ncbi:unnamed protein product [Ectocarpus sp. 13 AM-2016]
MFYRSAAHNATATATATTAESRSGLPGGGVSSTRRLSLLHVGGLGPHQPRRRERVAADLLLPGLRGVAAAVDRRHGRLHAGESGSGGGTAATVAGSAARPDLLLLAAGQAVLLEPRHERLAAAGGGGGTFHRRRLELLLRPRRGPLVDGLRRQRLGRSRLHGAGGAHLAGAKLNRPRGVPGGQRRR